MTDDDARSELVEMSSGYGSAGQCTGVLVWEQTEKVERGSIDSGRDPSSCARSSINALELMAQV